MARRRLATHRLTEYDMRTLVNKETENGCWEWLGKLDRDGYGVVWINKTYKQAHREVWSLLRAEEIPEQMELDHLCKNRKCVNPEHLECVSKQENIARRWNKGTTNVHETKL